MDRQREETTGDASAGPHLCFPVNYISYYEEVI